MNKDELTHEAIELAQEKYGKDYFAALWGSASALLSEKDLKVIISVMKK